MASDTPTSPQSNATQRRTTSTISSNASSSNNNNNNNISAQHPSTSNDNLHGAGLISDLYNLLSGATILSPQIAKSILNDSSCLQCVITLIHYDINQYGTLSIGMHPRTLLRVLLDVVDHRLKHQRLFIARHEELEEWSLKRRVGRKRKSLFRFVSRQKSTSNR